MNCKTEEILLKKIDELTIENEALKETIIKDMAYGKIYGVGTYGPLTAEEHAKQLRNYRILCAGLVGKKRLLDLSESDLRTLRRAITKGQEFFPDLSEEVDDFLFYM